MYNKNIIYYIKKILLNRFFLIYMLIYMLIYIFELIVF